MMDKLNTLGIASKELLQTKFPKEEKLLKPKAITECYEEIPCNPCSTVCPFDAIYIGDDINTPPQVDFDKCTGCGICVYNCPGLAIFTTQIKEDTVIMKIPYEFIPYPDAGKKYQGLNREGNEICTVFIKKVSISKRQDRTAIIEVVLDKEFMYDFITIGGRA
jgi:Fe-S-cluster-containing hydrogenase component 2